MEKFDETANVNYKDGERVCGVYYDYASDAEDVFNVMARYETADKKLHTVEIEEGKYFEFYKLTLVCDELRLDLCHQL